MNFNEKSLEYTRRHLLNIEHSLGQFFTPKSLTKCFFLLYQIVEKR